MSITQILSLSVEALQGKNLAELSELHKALNDSKQKKAIKKADLIAGIITAKKKQGEKLPEAPKVDEQPSIEEAKELAPVENSTKAPVKPKLKPKTSTKAPLKQQIKEAEADEPKAEEKKPEPQKKPITLKKKRTEAPDLSKMSQEELIAYASTLQEQSEHFPLEIPAEKSTYKRTEFETLKDIQKELIERPMTLYIFADERLDDKLTQFLVLFANAEVVVLFDRNRQKNSTITLKAEQLEAENIIIDKKQFKYSFYSRVANK